VTDGQTLRDSKDRAYASHRAVKMEKDNQEQPGNLLKWRVCVFRYL